MVQVQDGRHFEASSALHPQHTGSKNKRENTCHAEVVLAFPLRNQTEFHAHRTLCFLQRDCLNG